MAPIMTHLISVRCSTLNTPVRSQTALELELCLDNGFELAHLAVMKGQRGLIDSDQRAVELNLR